MTKPRIVIPTYKRAGNIHAHELFNPGDVELVVCESEAPIYRKEHPDQKLLVYPDKYIGLPKTRQWIHEQSENVFMIDDDVKKVFDMTVGMGESPKDRFPRGDRLVDIIIGISETAEQMGCFLYGAEPPMHPTSFNPMQPFRLSGLVYGHAMGVRQGGKLFYNTALRTRNDEWISLINAFYHRTIFVDSRYSFDNTGTFKNVGGLATERTVQSSMADYEIIRTNFGDAITIGEWKDSEVPRSKVVIPW